MNEKYGNEDCLLGDFIKIERYIKLKDYDKAMDYLEKVYEMHDMNMFYLATNRYYRYLKDNPRYHNLLKKMNLE